VAKTPAIDGKVSVSIIHVYTVDLSEKRTFWILEDNSILQEYLKQFKAIHSVVLSLNTTNNPSTQRIF
jgi:hypothetical protein